MIEPNKYTNIDLSVVSISAEVIKLLRHNKMSKFDDVFNKIVYKKGIKSKDVFLSALGFLFLLGKVKYHQENDILELCI